MQEILPLFERLKADWAAVVSVFTDICLGTKEKKPSGYVIMYRPFARSRKLYMYRLNGPNLTETDIQKTCRIIESGKPPGKVVAVWEVWAK